MKTIFVIIGETGEYSDRSEWLVRAVRTEDRAQKFIRELEFTYRSVQAKGYGSQREKDAATRKCMSKLDPDFSEDYTGTSYYYGEVTIEDK